MVKIREIKEHDNKKIEKIIKQSLESFGLDIPGTAYFDPQLSNLSEFYKQQSNGKYWVVVNEQDEVLGGVGIAAFGENTEICELQKLYVKPEAQGKGLARKLMNVALDFAANHYANCYLETSTKLETANLLYSKLGFEQLKEPLEGSDHNAMDAWYMKKLA